jgi:cytochrome c oxidase subunit II
VTGRPTPARRVPRPAALVVLAASLAACAPDARDSITDPATPQAEQIDWLWQLSLWMGTAVWVIVMVLLAVPIVRSRRHQDRAPEAHRSELAKVSSPGAELDEPIIAADPTQTEEAQRDERVRSRLLWIGGIIGPAIILLILLMATGRVGALTAHVEEEGQLVIDVHGHMFWWEVHYPEQDITTANEIHVPVDQPVRLRLTTEDVIHSFWIPRVHGKVDMIPGTTNILSFEATETGRFRGQCAEYCGIAHAQMVAFLEVQEQGDFDAWVEDQQADAAEPTTDDEIEGERVFIESGCAACHAVQGTQATALVGPDLTHLASRGSLAAGIVPNTRENLEQLIVDPWGLKPGNPMPPTQLEDDELEALLDYLEVLE